MLMMGNGKDDDSIYPFMAGEQVLGKYSYFNCWSKMETILILSNIRILTRYRQRTGCCGHRSQYNSIQLDTISMVVENPQSVSSAVILGNLFVLIAGLVAVVAGAILGGIPRTLLLVIGIITTVGTIIGLLYMLLHKVKLLTVKGDFGSVSWVLEKDKSRDVCSKLPELIYQLKGQRY
ncbi:unnamed protein product [Didymodactylos carnosus]|uniref:Uncharacterized protein n=1 Tax=Didymodactylos carnosus TaxID=1234261 RepID=A0A814IGC4_9BILA|nr:unnamed protein product [Didymodactylos carnosus]CAF3794326.1 unnamed protein product [Didymodactylos carnosus]